MRADPSGRQPLRIKEEDLRTSGSRRCRFFTLLDSKSVRVPRDVELDRPGGLDPRRLRPGPHLRDRGVLVLGGGVGASHDPDARSSPRSAPYPTLTGQLLEQPIRTDRTRLCLRANRTEPALWPAVPAGQESGFLFSATPSVVITGTFPADFITSGWQPLLGQTLQVCFLVAPPDGSGWRSDGTSDWDSKLVLLVVIENQRVWLWGEIAKSWGHVRWELVDLVSGQVRSGQLEVPATDSEVMVFPPPVPPRFDRLLVRPDRVLVDGLGWLVRGGLRSSTKRLRLGRNFWLVLRERRSTTQSTLVALTARSDHVRLSG